MPRPPRLRLAPPPPPDLRAIVLARVSTKEQAEGFSLDAQLVPLRAYARAHGFDVVDEVSLAETATKAEQRRGFRRVLAMLGAPKGPRHLLVEKADRLTRNLADFAAVDELRLRLGVRIHLVKEGVVIGPDAPSAVMDQWEIQAWLARRFSRNLSEETKKGMREKRRQGGWCHRAPVGLVNRRDEHHAWLEHDPDRAPKVAALFRAVADDALTVHAATELASAMALTTRTGRRLSTSAVHALLRHPLVAGILAVDGQMQRADIEPIVDDATWWAVQDVLSSRGPGKASKMVRRLHAFQGLARCGACGRAFVGETQPGRHRRGAWTYYRCAGRCGLDGTKPVKESVLVDAVAARLDRAVITDEQRLEIRAELAAMMRDHNGDTRDEHAELVREERTLRDRIASMYEDRLAGRLSAEDFDARSAKARRRLAGVEAERAHCARVEESWLDRALAIADAVTTAGDAIRDANPEILREVVGDLLDGPILVRAGVAVVQLHPALESLISRAACEPPTGDGGSVTYATREGRDPAWLPRCDSVRTPADDALLRALLRLTASAA